MDPDTRVLAHCLFRTRQLPRVFFLLCIPDDHLVAVLAGRFHSLSDVGFIVNFTLLQVRINSQVKSGLAHWRLIHLVLLQLWSQLNGTQPSEGFRSYIGISYFFLKGRK